MANKKKQNAGKKKAAKGNPFADKKANPFGGKAAKKGSASKKGK